MKILLVEDDHLQAELIAEKVRERFASVEIERVKTESDFFAIQDRVAAQPPDIVIMDAMLRWADASPEMPEAPEEVLREGFHRAGLRCQKILAGRKETEHVPVILYTVLEGIDLKSDLEELRNESQSQIKYLRKQSDLTPLLDEIYRKALRGED